MNDAFYKSCLKEELARRCEKNPRYSMKSLARAMKLNAASLSQFLSGKQVPSFKAAEKILASLELSPEDRALFLGSLAQTHKRRGLKRMGRAFRDIPSAVKPRDLSLDLFRVIADPIHYAILDSTSLSDFRSDPRWIATRLGIAITETKLAIDRLLLLGLLEDRRGRWQKAQRHFTTADKHLTDPALRRHQRLVLEKAASALENEPIERRSTNSLTLSANPAKMPEAKQLIQKFMEEMVALMNEGPQTDVYQISFSMFPLTKPKTKGV